MILILAQNKHSIFLNYQISAIIHSFIHLLCIGLLWACVILVMVKAWNKRDK